MRTERNTKQKTAIYHALTVLDHPSATEVFEYLQDDLSEISRGTVFRVLGAFADCGKVRRLIPADGEVRYDFRTLPHAHACCKRCKRIFDVRLPETWRTVSVEGFTVDDCDMEFSGICDHCRMSDSEKNE